MEKDSSILLGSRIRSFQSQNLVIKFVQIVGLSNEQLFYLPLCCYILLITFCLNIPI
jgi:hypothetical protein